jgi:ketosteroid isomerase-like protein
MTSRSVEERLQRLEDERAVIRTLYEYAHGLDYGPQQAFLDVFTADGTWQRVEGRRPARSFQNERGLTRMYQDHTHAPDYFHKHVVVNPAVTLDGDAATARSYLLLVSEHPDGPYVRAFSRCTDQLVRCVDGRWRIARREAELECWAERDFPPAPWTASPAVVS